MEFKNVNNRLRRIENIKLERAFLQFEMLLGELKKEGLPDEIVKVINGHIDEFNTLSGSGKEIKNALSDTQSKILAILEKEANLVPKFYYRTFWGSIGMTVGIAVGVALGTAFNGFGGMVSFGFGLPIGMVSGMAVGSSAGAALDKKAFEEGRQLDFEVKF